LNDANIMRGLAHPLRLRILRLLSVDGPASVSTLASRAGESTASVSYHLSQLARFGLVEEAAELRTGRERPWRARHRGLSWDAGQDAETASAAAELRIHYLGERARVIDEYLAVEGLLPAEWRQAAFFLDDVGYLTPVELVELQKQISAVLGGFRRLDPADRPPGARMVSFFAYGLPAHTPTEQGEPDREAP
jgi:DNA-binding transcriptional ArsR family regulator